MLNLPIDYFEHDADIGIIGRGSTLTEAFEKAAFSMFSIMSDLDSLQPESSVEFIFTEKDPEYALVEWLNLLLAHAAEKHMVFCKFHLNHENSKWQGKASGQSWQPSMLKGTEVKGATLTALSVQHHGNYWEARCVVDV